MSNHQATPCQDTAGKWFARCVCGWSTKASRHDERWQCDDEIRVHLDNVQRAMASLHRAQSSMKTERDHARAMMDDTTVPAAQRAVWKILFDGYDQRLNDSTEVAQDELF